MPVTGAGGGASYTLGGDSQLTVRGGGGIEASTSSGFGGKFSAGVSGNVDDNHNVGLSVGTDSFGLSVTKKVTKEFYTEEGFGLKKD
jgi:hypothetical protein